ncbi:hypothetical protein BH09GEM1_BH09GEM1_27190 [soil metagenome]
MLEEHQFQTSPEEVGNLKAALDEHAIVAITDRRGKITFVNDRFCAISGYSREELLGQDQRIVNSGHHPKDFIRGVSTTISHGGIWKGEIEGKAKDGSLHWVDTTIVPLLGDDGIPHKYAAILTEITARKRAEEALREREKIFATAFRSCPAGIALLTLDDRYVEVNAAFSSMVGYASEEMIGQTGIDLGILTAPERELIGSESDRGSGAAKPVEVKVRHRDGAFVDVLLTNALVTLRGIPHRLNTIFDITARKQEEATRFEREQAFEALEYAPDIVSRFDRNFRHLYVNRVVAQATGLPASAFIGKTHEEMGMPRHLQEEWHAILGDVFASGEERETEFEFPTPDGPRFYHSRLVPEYGPDGGIHSILNIARDITKRKLAEEALRASEAGCATAFNSSPIGLVILRLDDLRMVEINKSFEMMSGYSRAEMVGRTTLEMEFYSAEVRAKQHALLRDEGGFRNVELEFRCKSGELRVVLFSVEMLTIRGKAHYIVSALDITARKNAENALRKSEASLLAAQAHARIGNWEMDLLKLTVTWSTEMFRMFQRDQSLGAPTFDEAIDSIYPEDRESFQRRFSRAITDRREFTDDVRIVRADGNMRWLEMHGELISDEVGQPIRMFGTSQDITERKQAEESLRMLSHAVEQSPASIVITDTAGNIEYVNPTCARITGYAREEMLGHNPRMLQSGAVSASTYEQLWATITAGNEWHGELQNRKKSGELYWEAVAISPIRDTAGRITHFLAVKEDITTRRKLEEQFRQSQKMEGIGRLAGGVAHDFNNILAAIRLQAGMLKDGQNLSPEHLELAGDIEEGVQRAAALTRQLLLFSRNEVLREQDLDLNQSIDGMIKMLRRTIGEDVQIQLKLAGQPMFLHADAAMMDQLLLNLVVNARDAMPTGGRLAIETSGAVFDEQAASRPASIRPGSFVCLSVSDTGCGIPPEILPKIFEPFFTTKEVGKGTGLGLATVFGIVQQHRGWINVDSAVGRGTTFRIYLPRREQLAERKPTGTTFTTLQGGKETILLVEDDPAVRGVLHRSLSRLGYQVLLACDGTDALSAWGEHRNEIDLVLTDMVLPGGMNGIEVAAHLLSENPELKVIYMSGYTAEVAHEDFPLKEGVNFLHKPFEPARLAQAVRAMLDEERHTGSAVAP